MVDQKRQAELRAAIELFFFGYRAFTSHPDRILGERALGRAHHRILYFIGHRPGIAISGLLDVLGVSKQALNAPLRQLLEMKLVAVTPAAHDRRFRELRLTAEGARLEALLTGTQMKLLASVFDAVSPGSEAGWRKVMARMPGRS